MIRRFFRWFRQPLIETLYAIPPGHAYHCSSCRWVCRDTIQSRCRKCGSTAVLPVSPTVQSLTEPVKVRLQAYERTHPVEKRIAAAREKKGKFLADETNSLLFLTDFRRKKGAA